MVSMKAKRELVARFRKDYEGSGRSEKGRILDSLCQTTGWARKYAMHALKALDVAPPRQRRRRARVYGPSEEAALVKVWKLSGFLASKRLAPFLDEFLSALERHGELSLPEPTRSKLAAISASTIDRLLRRHRNAHPPALSLTRPGSLLKREVAVRTGTDWNDARPGFCEIDTVGHCGGKLDDAHFWTLGITDVSTGWSEFAPLKSKGREETLMKLKSLRARLPFDLLGLDFDNGSEFLNYHLVRFCQSEGILLTRCRPYHKNDQCRIEQKNGALVRKHAGYGRYDTDKQFALLNRLYGVLRLLVNFFEPSLKGKEKAATPYRRLLASGILSKDKADELESIYLALNPVKLREELLKVKMELHELESLVSFLDEATV
ncbi:DDE-type integrase/transposase/recombinase [Candidatus Nitrosymbiomonas proteolyticus]|uniref:DDE-type integrase/transposase/recombinase n=1 Tax=Candidatus Nitrosymbiomonas proteolyticus TaxID=2608984 RepID=A0A809RXY5_9BACT|nr:DDE-type integrase/transposase/recombinase [Candidatus Nitrosymbiomonas proteolyticus]